MLNMHEFKQMQKFDIFTNMVLNRIPEFVSETLHYASANTTLKTSEVLHLVDCFVLPCNLSASYVNITGIDVSQIENISFGTWIRRNDTLAKSYFLANELHLAFTETILNSFYQILSDVDLLGVRNDHLSNSSLVKNCRQYFSENICRTSSHDNKTSWQGPFSNITDFVSLCGLVFALRQLDSNTHCQLNISKLILTKICFPVSRCSLLSLDSNDSITTAILLKEFCFQQLWQFAKYNTIDWLRNVVFETRSVSSVVTGSDAEYALLEEGLQSNISWFRYTCIHSGHSESNMKATGAI